MPGLTPARRRASGAAGAASGGQQHVRAGQAEVRRRQAGEQHWSGAAGGCRIFAYCSSSNMKNSNAHTRRPLKTPPQCSGHRILGGSSHCSLKLALTLEQVQPLPPAQPSPFSSTWPFSRTSRPSKPSPFSRSSHCSMPLRSGEVASWERMGPRARMLGAMKGDSSGMASARGQAAGVLARLQLRPAMGSPEPRQRGPRQQRPEAGGRAACEAQPGARQHGGTAGPGDHRCGAAAAA